VSANGVAGVNSEGTLPCATVSGRNSGGGRMADLLDDHAIAAIKIWARSEPLILEIRAFGSRVRGLNKDGGPIRPDSDLDLAVTVDLPSSATPLEVQRTWTPLRQRGAAALAPGIPWPLDLQVLEDGGSPCLRSHVADCSRLIYARS
jgi:hypothetical protein